MIVVDMERRSAFEDLFEADYQKVFRAAYLVCADRRLAEDAAQEAFARALARWDRLSGQTYVSAYIMRTALNHVLKTKHVAARRLQLGPGPEGHPELAETELDLWRGITSLPRNQRKAVVLHYFADLQISEVALAMRCREGTVKSHLSRARAALRHYLQEDRS